MGDRPPYRLAIFDFDGTLADSAAWFLRAMNEAAPRFGFRPVADDEMPRLRGMHAREILRHVGLSPWRMPFLARHLRARMAAEIDEIRPFPGIGALLRRLEAAGVTLAVVTSNAEPNVRRVLGEDARRIAHFACGASVFGKRPHLRRVLRRARVAPADALAVGDELRDLHAARAEGIPFGAVAWGYTDADVLHAAGARERFDTVAALAARLAP